MTINNFIDSISFFPSLGRLYDLPSLSSINPLIFLSILSTLFISSLESTKELRQQKNQFFIISGIMVLLLGTTGMFFVSGYYLNTHIFSAYSLFTSFLMFFNIRNPGQKKNTNYIFLGVFALIGFFLSRVESPIFILLVLAYSLQYTGHFSFQQLIKMYSPVLFILIHLLVIFFAYPAIETRFWTDNRLLLPICSYVLFFIVLLIKNKVPLLNRNNGISKIVFPGFVGISILVFFLNTAHQFKNLLHIIGNLFNNPFAGNNLWGFFWWLSLIILLCYLLVFPPKNKHKAGTQNNHVLLFFVVTYALLILDLGFFRKEYSFGRWGDSAMRMFVHVVPIIAFWENRTILKIMGGRQDRLKSAAEHNKQP